MSACEWCWAEANRRVMLLGGSVAERYREVLNESDSLTRELALCPERRKIQQRGER